MRLSRFGNILVFVQMTMFTLFTACDESPVASEVTGEDSLRVELCRRELVIDELHQMVQCYREWFESRGMILGQEVDSMIYIDATPYCVGHPIDLTRCEEEYGQ